MIEAGGLLLSALAAFLLTGLIRRYALRSNLIDVPNRRSSHTQPTPRGGGMAIVAVFSAGLVALSALDVLTANQSLALIGAGTWVAFIGFLDDHRHIPAGWRLLAHFAGAGWGLYWLGGFPPLLLFGETVDLGGFGHLFGLLYLVWLLNLYNFMDGIDGIAGIEAVTACLGGSMLFLIGGHYQAWLEPALLAAAAAGFLLWNFPPARIFMGDAGSGFLGIVLGMLSLQAAWLDPALFWSWLCLLGVFIVDATWTLWRRFRRGERLHEAHRSHAYQFAARRYGSHKTVSLFVGAVNLFWLLPSAILIGLGVLNGIAGVALAYLPLLLSAIKFNAGGEEMRG
ncbi:MULTISPECIES: MraY family glycosyltransferase [Methylomicrobium]|uniref:UDP-N-acetylmuramyl pentapeptide phosphotransferase/UDP-N-acetylglucosamine-1-phosphate transferase n=1 Tax=Methylomicrobium album BG8 TaxID=686340 RepID=H8GP94_METAL|nr:MULTISPECIES: glycosyltransferase family 4 protein [Methylomicrobium]EIC29680.1 UDP-N-acetylmuramyl pentapeptide phosphotransferase/UDP-N-acetylglucosamine-1-phosphate transferase [Methylomicrobium album BG8]